MQLPFMSIPVGDVLAEAGGLSTEEFGAFVLLLMHMWVAGGELPNDDRVLATCVRLTPGKWRRLKPRLWPHFMETGKPFGSKITERRLRQEYERALVKRAKAAVNGAKGGRATAWKTNKAGLANAVRLPSPNTQPDDIRRYTGSGASGLPPIPIQRNTTPSESASKGAGGIEMTDSIFGKHASSKTAAPKSKESSPDNPNDLLRALDRRSAKRGKSQF